MVMQYLEWDADADDFALMKDYLNGPDSKQVLKLTNLAAKEISYLTINEICKKYTQFYTFLLNFKVFYEES